MPPLLNDALKKSNSSVPCIIGNADQKIKKWRKPGNMAKSFVNGGVVLQLCFI